MYLITYPNEPILLKVPGCYTLPGEMTMCVVESEEAVSCLLQQLLGRAERSDVLL